MNALNLKNMIKCAGLAAVVLLAGSALAASKGSLQLQHPTSVGGKQLATGDYTVQWEGSGEQVELKVYQGKNEVASTLAHVMKVEHPAEYNQAVVSTNSDGSASLSEIRFRGKNFALLVSNEGGGSGAAGAGR